MKTIYCYGIGISVYGDNLVLNFLNEPDKNSELTRIAINKDVANALIGQIKESFEVIGWELKDE